MPADEKPMEDRLPYLAALIGALIMLGVGQLWHAYHQNTLMEEQQLVIAGLVVVGIVVELFWLGMNPQALLAGLLVELLLLSRLNDPNSFRVLLIVLATALVLNVGGEVMRGVLGTGSVRERSTPSQNTAFAGLALAANIAMFVILYRQSWSPPADIEFGRNALYVLAFILAFSIRPFVTIGLEGSEFTIVDMNPAIQKAYDFVMAANGPDGASTQPEMAPDFISDPNWYLQLGLLLVIFFVRLVLVSPPFWAAAAAALRQLGFRFWEVGAWLRQTRRAWFAGLWATALWGTLLTVPLIGAYFLPDPAMQGMVVISLLGINYFIMIRGMGRGAHNV